jgi:hypothetical protein
MTPVVENPEILSPDAIATWQAEALASAETMGDVVDLPDRATTTRIGGPW